MTDEALTEKQFLVINALTAGFSLAKAAEIAAIHTLEIDLWRRNYPAFQNALLQVQYGHALQFHSRRAA